MNITSILQLLFHANQLKQTERTGWVQRGVPNSENVAAHSFGVVFTTMILAQLVSQPINLERALVMAALHDLPEAIISDIPRPAQKYLPKGAKTTAERLALQDLLANGEFAVEWLEIWEEMHQNETAVAHLVKDADKLELFVQAFIYEEQTGNRRLGQFWQHPPKFHFAEVQALYDELFEQRKKAFPTPSAD